MWTRKELFAEMKKAGWKRPEPAFAIYRHTETGMTIDMDEYKRLYGRNRTMWSFFAEMQQTPPHEEAPF